MKIHYLSCHSVLEYDEVVLFTQMGHQVFSNGAYLDPVGNKILPRPGIGGAPYYPEYEKLAREFPKTHLPPELIEPFDLIIVMHTPEWITENWEKMKHKKVIWRSIGQSNRNIENMIRRMRYEGMRIVRYSPMESNIPDYLGADATIPFYKDEEEFNNWNGNEKRVINFTQSLKARRSFCHHDDIMKMVNGFPALIFGTGNDNLGPLNGGELPYELMKGQLRDNRVFVYGGTWPAPYTLTFQEAMMTGIPIVSIGRKLAEELPDIHPTDRIHFFEVADIIKNGENGFISDDIDELRTYIHRLLEDHGLAKKIGAAGRETAIRLWRKLVVKNQWKSLFDSL